MRKYSEKRSIRGMFVNPKAQMRQAYLIGFSATMAMSVLGILSTITKSGILKELELLYRMDTDTLDKIRQTMNLGTAYMMIVGLISVFGIFAYTISLGHRFFGPVIPLKAQIDKMIQGDFSARVNLRKGDELHELAHKLNELAASLEKK